MVLARREPERIIKINADREPGLIHEDIKSTVLGRLSQ